jgi:plastocyanin
MSILGRKISVRMVAALAVMMVLGALLPAMTTAPAREITLVVRDMTFYLEGDFEIPNPEIAVKAGDSVRIVVRNEERGLTHDFAVPAIGASVGPLDWREQGEVTFDVPATRGTYEYVCRPHMLMMKGTLKVY